MSLILGIETSCDETAVAVLDSDGGIEVNLLSSQVEAHAPFGGVVPELASRDHVRKTLPLVRAVLDEAGAKASDINGVAYTAGPGLVGALLVTGLECVIPYQRAWKPARSDIANDTLFMILVQVLLPRLLALLAVMALVDPLRNLHPATATLWPHRWSLAAQVLLMLISAELLRYWLHRLAHTWPLLWRLHAVHHSPEKLYWLNVGRFHPLEKALQFVLDALPFMLLGVNEQVIALYFVFYSINGFFQHSNIHLRYGLLNYLISSAELHRWHHSRIPPGVVRRAEDVEHFRVTRRRVGVAVRAVVRALVLRAQDAARRGHKLDLVAARGQTVKEIGTGFAAAVVRRGRAGDEVRGLSAVVQVDRHAIDPRLVIVLNTIRVLILPQDRKSVV